MKNLFHIFKRKKPPQPTAADVWRSSLLLAQFMQLSVELKKDMQSVSDALAERMPPLIESYETWREISIKWLDTVDHLNLVAASTVRRNLEQVDGIVDMWRALATSLKENVEGGNNEH
jgi:hypothetical protein